MSRIDDANKRAKEKADEIRRKAYRTPAWTSERPKPNFDPTIWTDPETVDVLAEYTDWHARHPHQITPRTLDSVLVQAGKDLQLASPRQQKKVKGLTEDDLENIDLVGKPLKAGTELVTYGNGQRAPTLSPEFTAPRIGERGKMAQVAKISYDYQNEATLYARYDSEDPWYKMSVKDTLETYHMDGDHTSIVLKPPKPRQKSAQQIAFEADAKWKAEQYGKYQGGGPNMSDDQMRILEKLALAIPTAKEKKEIVGPWGDTYKYTEFTAHGTILNDFNKADLERRVKFAIEAHEEVLAGDIKRQEDARQARIAAKRMALGLTKPQTPTSRPATGLGQSQIYPSMDTVQEESADITIEDLDNQSHAGTYDGSMAGNSVSSMGGMTYQELEHDGTIGDVGSLGDGPSLTSGSTYLHKKHGDNISALNMKGGSSQSGSTVLENVNGGGGSRKSSVDERTLQNALAMAYVEDNSHNGVSAGGKSVGGNSISDDLSQITGAGTHNGGTDGGDPSVASSKKKSKKQEKLENILKSKGLSKEKEDKRGSKSKSQSKVGTTKRPSTPAIERSMATKIALLPIAAILSVFRLISGTSAPPIVDDEVQDISNDDDISISDSDEEDVKKLTEDDLLDKYDLMKKKLGGDEVLEAQADAWQKFAAVVRKESKRETNLFDNSMDLPDAVEKNNLAKVVFCLAVGQNDPNMRGNNDEPILITLISKILAQDAITGSLVDDKNETPDRVKMFRVLQALVKFQVEINTTEAKNGIPPLHMAIAAGNEKLVTYLLENGADINLLSNPPAGDVTGSTALMEAGKYGNIDLMTKLIRRGADMYTVDADGRNVLHYAGMYGMTRASMFLLRCGHDKRLKDNNKQTAGELAEELGFTVAGQAIMTYAVMGYKAQFALEYFTERARLEALPKGVMADMAGAASAAFGNAAAALGDAAEASKQAMKNLGGFFLKIIGCGTDTAKIDVNNAFDEVLEFNNGGGPDSPGSIGAGDDSDDN